MLASFSTMRRSVSGSSAAKVASLAKASTPLAMRSSATWTTRRFQSSWKLDDATHSQDFSPIVAGPAMDRIELAHGAFFALHRPLLGINSGPMFAKHQPSAFDLEEPLDDLSSHFSTLQLFTPPPAPKPSLSYLREQKMKAMTIDGDKQPVVSILDQLHATIDMHMTSVQRKRRIKMKKHKYKKLRKRTRALRKRLGK